MLRFSLTTLGCKVNQYDANAAATLLRRSGCRLTGPGQDADLVVINTCCVTTTAMRKSRQAIRKACRQAPGAAALVLGCYSDYDRRRICELLASLDPPPARSLVAGHQDDLPAAIQQFLRSLPAGEVKTSVQSATGLTGQRDDSRYDLSMSADHRRRYPDAFTTTTIRASARSAVKDNVPPGQPLSEIDSFIGHQRAFVKVQDGCDAFCSYCIVPYLRRRVWSRDVDHAVAECARLVAAGHREIVLTGVCLGAYGQSTTLRRRWGQRESMLPELVARVAGIEGLWRVRLSSLAPDDLTDRLLAVCRDTPNFAPHFHLPLQSGSQRILRLMNRRYTVDQFRRTVDRLRQAFDDPAITTDIIVGFPSEDEADFAATLDVARYAGFAKVHAFPFSPVKPTAAWVRRDQAPPAKVVRERLARLARLARELAGAYRRRFIGRVVPGLVQRARKCDNGRRQAMTDRYLKVSFPTGKEDPTGKIVRLRIDGEARRQLHGVIVAAE